MAEEHDLSTLVGWEGYDEDYPISEYTEHLNPHHLLSETRVGSARVFCMANNNYLVGSGSAEAFLIQEKIKRLLVETIKRWEHTRPPCLLQFWAPKVVGTQIYLATSDLPFAVHRLCKGLFWYRKHSVDHPCILADGNAAVKEKKLGPVERVLLNRHPESSPDLRLYSASEFPSRDHAARCGARSYLALPVFCLPEDESGMFFVCCGVLEVLYFGLGGMRFLFNQLARGLREADLRSTHIGFVGVGDYNGKWMPPKYNQQAESEIENVLEAVIQVVPQLHMAQAWIPCKQCANTTTCMERTAFVVATDKKVNSCKNIDLDILEYVQACEFHNLQIGKGTIAGTMMSSNNKSCFCRNLCNFSNISENPLAHYAQKARLSFCFGICLESKLQNSDGLCFIEFFLQPNSRLDPCGGSFWHLLFGIMKTKLKSFKVPSSVSEVCKGMLLSSVQFVDHGINLKHAQGRTHQHSEEFTMLTVMEGHDEMFSSVSDFAKYLHKDDHLSYCKHPEERRHGWLFWYPEAEELSENKVRVQNSIQKKIKLILGRMMSKWNWTSYCLVQFWAPQMNGDNRFCLGTTGQAFALGHIYKGLGLFRKRCVEHYYFVDEGAKEEEVGPPGRAFRTGHPEMTHDVRLYSTTEFPLKNDAARCKIQRYIAFPVFNHRHQCVGILEFLEFPKHITLERIREAVEAARLSPAHIDFKLSSQGCLALTEIKKAFQLATRIPQLNRIEVWVPYNNCASTISNSLTCMELVASTNHYRGLAYQPILCPFDLVQTGKGIVGMLLASKNKSCFCRNSCDFTITERLLSHYAQQERLDVCFAICLQSSHTGDLLYVLEFFVKQGPGNYKYLRSFLYFLLPIMKQKLKSFKVASGQQLGEELVVDIVEFSQGNQPNPIEFGQLNEFPVKFQIVQYGQKEHQQSHVQQVNFYGMDTVTSVVAEGDQCTSTSADSLEKHDTGHQQPQDQRVNLDAMDSVTDVVAEGNQCTHTAADGSEKDVSEHQQPQDQQVNLDAMDSVTGIVAEGDQSTSTAADALEKDDTEHEQPEDQQVNLDPMNSVTDVVAEGNQCTRTAADSLGKDVSEHQQPQVQQVNLDAMDSVTVVAEGDQSTSTAADALEVSSDAMNSFTSVVAEGNQCTIAADDSEKEDTTKKTAGGKKKHGLFINLEDLKPHFGKKLKDVAEKLGVGRSTIKRACRSFGIPRWPSREKYKTNPSLFKKKSNSNEHARHSRQSMQPSSSTSSLPVQQIVPLTNNTKSTRNLTLLPDANAVIIKAKYGDNIVKFQLSLQSGMDKLVEEVAAKQKLKIGSFELKYVDEDNDEVSLTCDTDLQLCLKSLTAAGENCFQVFVQLTPLN